MAFNLLKKLFIGGEWGVAYKKKGDIDYTIIKMPRGYWVADPMLFEYKDTHYLFAEVYENKKKKAGIGYFVFENEIPIYKGLIISNDYHMSYPCVFEYKNNIYMIPETSANSSLELYKAISFPNKWEKISTILDECSFVDTTVFLKDNIIYLLTYTKNKSFWEVILYSLKIDEAILKEESRLSYNKNVGRPAGYLLNKNGYFLRPAQDSNVKYGERILLYKIKSLFPFNEELVDKLEVSDLSLPKKAKRTHTYSEDNVFVVVDFFAEKFELFHALDIYKRSHFKKRTR